LNNTLAGDAGDVRDSGQGGAVFSDRREGRQREYASTTALKIACSMDALPGPCAASKHTTGRPAGPLLCAKATTEPTLIDGDMGGGARAGSHALAVADYVGRRTDTRGWVRRGKGRVAVRASKSARIVVDARRLAGNGVVAVRRRISYDEVRQGGGDGLRSGNLDTFYGDWVGHQERGEVRQTKTGVDLADNNVAARRIGDYELPNVPAHVGDSTRVKGMRIQPAARVKRGRACPKEQAENWENGEGTHEAGRDANAPSGDKAMSWPLS